MNDAPDNIKAWLVAGHYDIEWPASKEKIKSIFKSRGGVSNTAAQNDNMKVALNRRFIIEQPPETRVKGQTHIKYVLNPEYFPEDKPFGEETDEVPF